MTQITVGLTGGIGSGKTFVSDYFQSLGVCIVDADIISRDVTSPRKPAVYEIARHFDPNLVNSEGILDRAQLRTIIFGDKVAKDWIESLLHPIIFKRINEELLKPSQSYTILSSPLLLETHQDELVDYTIVVDIPESLQVERSCIRDSSNKETIEKIINSQMTRSERLAKADYTLDNSGSKDDTIRQIQLLHKQFLELSAIQ